MITFMGVVHGQSSPDTSAKISLLFIGDIMGHDDQITAAKDALSNSFDYTDVFSYIKPVISDVDIAFANFEVTLAGPPYRGYPQFSSPAEFAVACRDAGIDCFATANNHVADRGGKGIVSTINKLDSLGISHTGSFINKACRDSLYPLVLTCKGISLTLLNYTYGTNGMVVPEPAMVNILDKDLITEDINKAKQLNTDLIILFLHWGTEYDTIPSSEQTEMAVYCFSQGVDLIIGSHPHVIQKMIWTKPKGEEQDNIVVYSLGNFVSNQRKPKTDGGLMVRIDLAQTGETIRVTNAGYYLTWVYMPIVNKKKSYHILPCSEFEDQAAMFSDHNDFLQMKKFILESRNLLDNQNVGIPEYKYKDKKWVLDF